MKKRPVDIIIPIYNAYEDLVICLESVYKHTDLDTNRLVLINDNSPDERIKPFLDEQQLKNNVIVIHNESNKGFSANINIGMSQSQEHDVLLLNSDTVVTRNWIEKITDCAYSNPFIGTVTPLSNNASLCSVPEFCEENKLPEGMDVDEVAQIVERCSMKKYPRITVAHGFCMFVKREVIEDIGVFDAATFGRGYGEENDFCNRAEQAGYIHVMCDDTYILHTGTKSFVSAEKEAYIREHDRILRDRYAIQMHGNDVLVRDNPNGYVCENVDIFLDAFNHKKTILYLLQSDFREDASDHVGGTQLHVKHLTEHIKKDYNVLVAARDGEYLNLTLYTDDKRRLWKFYIGEKKPYYQFSDAKLDKIWRNVLSAFHVDLVHVHHVYTTSFDLIYVANEYNIPIVYTFHDYFMVSPSLKLLNDKDEVITSENETSNSWTLYLEKKCDVYNGVDYISIWRKRCHDAMKMCDHIVVPDDSVKDIVVGYYSDLCDKIDVVPHGYEYINDRDKQEIQYTEKVKYRIDDIVKEGNTYKVRGWAYVADLDAGISSDTYVEFEVEGKHSKLLPVSKKHREDVRSVSGKMDSGFEVMIPSRLICHKDVKLRIAIQTGEGKLCYAVDAFELPRLTPAKNHANLNIAFIGGINKEKGGAQIVDLVKSHKRGVNWFLFGNVGHGELENLKQDNFMRYGAYDSNELPVLMEAYKIDVVCILSIWPETYSYTLTEAILCGLPVIVSDTGALGNRVKKYNCGWTIGLENMQEELASIVNELIEDKSVLETFKQAIKNVKIDTLDEMTDAYSKIYVACDDADSRYETADYEWLYNSFADRTHSIDKTGKENESISVQNMDIINEYNQLINTVTYKLCKKAQDVRFPGKETLYNFMKKRV